MDVKILLKNRNTSEDWIYLAQDKDKWWALVNTVVNYRIPYQSEWLTSGSRIEPETSSYMKN